VGIDLGDRKSQLCLLDASGERVRRETLVTAPAAFQERFARLTRTRVILEVGTHSPWVSRLLESLGHEVIVANTARLYGGKPKRLRRKNDRIDAEYLARQGRADPALLFPLRHRGEDAQRDLALLQARDVLVRSRSQLINHVRGSVKAVGSRIPSCSAETFHRTAAQHLPASLESALVGVLTMIEALTKQIRAHEAQVETLARDHYPETERLRQVKGVGPIISLAFVLVLEDPDRFRRSRTVGAWLGLVPQLSESGAYRGELRISKAGDAFLRRVLLQGAHYILTQGPDTDLQRWGRSIWERGGRTKKAKKRAAVALARRLAVLLHRLWTSGAQYQPLLHSETAFVAA
jgi:transposase